LSVQMDVTVCLIVHALVSICSSTMPLVLLCMTYATVDSRHVVQYAFMYKQKTILTNKMIFLTSKNFEEQRNYDGNKIYVSSLSPRKALPATVSRKRIRRSHLRSVMLSRL